MRILHLRRGNGSNRYGTPDQLEDEWLLLTALVQKPNAQTAPPELT